MLGRALKPRLVLNPVDDAVMKVVPASVATMSPGCRAGLKLTTPVLLILNRVVVALAVDEPIAKRVVLVEPLFAWMPNVANGDDVPIPILPFTTGAAEGDEP